MRAVATKENGVSDLVRQLAGAIDDWAGRRTGSMWVSSEAGAVYIRKAGHSIEGRLATTLDLASIEMATPGRGDFTRFLEEVVRLNPWDAVYIENVLNPRFAAHLRKAGWTEIPNPGSPCFYLLRWDS